MIKNYNSSIALRAISSASAIVQLRRPPEALRWPPPLKYFSAIFVQERSSTERRLTQMSWSCSVSSRREMLRRMPFIWRGMLTSPSASPFW